MKNLLLLFGLCATFFARPTPLLAQTNIRPEPNGKRILFVDGTHLRPEPGGKRLLCLENDNVRPTPNGIRLAFWDGQTLRRTPGGKILLFVDGHTIRPYFNGPRLYFIDGPKFSQAQLQSEVNQLRKRNRRPGCPGRRFTKVRDVMPEQLT